MLGNNADRPNKKVDRPIALRPNSKETEEGWIEFEKKQKARAEVGGLKTVSSSKIERITAWSVLVPPEEKTVLA